MTDICLSSKERIPRIASLFRQAIVAAVQATGWLFEYSASKHKKREMSRVCHLVTTITDTATAKIFSSSMLALARRAPKRVSRLTTAIRGLADVIGTPPDQPTPPALSSPPKGSIPVREDHGLYAFFRRKEGADLVGGAQYEVVETPEKMQRLTGKSCQTWYLCSEFTRDVQAGGGGRLNYG